MIELRGNQCQCSACGEVFRSLSGFDAHRTGHHSTQEPGKGRRCLTGAEMRSKGLAPNGEGVWRTPRIWTAVVKP